MTGQRLNMRSRSVTTTMYKVQRQEYCIVSVVRAADMGNINNDQK